MNDKATFDRMFREWYAQFFYFAYHFISDTEVCKDIVSDAFEYLWRNYDKIEEETVRTYLYTIVRTRCIDYLRRQNARLLSDGSFAVNEVDLDPYIYWKEGSFYFDSVTLVDMMKEIGRWYNVDVEFRNQAAMNLQIHFFSDRRQDILHTMELLNRMEKVHALYEGGKVVIE